jgi:hypothetical protein
MSTEWDAQSRTTLSLDFFEEYRPARMGTVTRIDGLVRAKLLLLSGCSMAEMREAIEEADATRRGRRTTILQLLSSTEQILDVVFDSFSSAVPQLI